ncbi:cytosolic carboxypeptidase 1-like isoform X3 [Ptychodera flava]|uniref:cytosolic carboxypeptidase 1-like isoform X3 n=1 Tax=Ptychodera flava TaxID=63121 RepID=UPI003969D2BA
MASVELCEETDDPRSRLGTLLQSLDRLSGSSNPDDIEQLRSITARLQHFVNTQDKIRKDVMSKSTSGLEILLSGLESSTDSQTSLNITYTLIDILLSGKRSTAFVSRGATQVVLTALITANREQTPCDELIVGIHTILAKIGSKDRKFGVKARLSGALPITLSLVRNNANNFKVLLPCLQVLKIYVANAVNSSCLGKGGAVSCMFRILAVCGRKHLNIVKLALDTLSQLVKSKSNSARAIGQGGMTILLTMAFDWHRSDTRNRHYNLRKSILIVIRNITSLKAGRRAFIQADGTKILYAIAQEMTEARECEPLVTIISLILRKCFPKNRLPVQSIKSCIPFHLPEAAAEHVEVPLEAQGDDVMDESDDQDDDLSSDDDEDDTQQQQQQEFDDGDEEGKSKNERQKRTPEDLIMYESFFPELLEFTEENYVPEDEETEEDKDASDEREMNRATAGAIFIPTAAMDSYPRHFSSTTVSALDSRNGSRYLQSREMKDNRCSLPNLSKYNYMVANGTSSETDVTDITQSVGGFRLVSDSNLRSSASSEYSTRSSAKDPYDTRSMDSGSGYSLKNGKSGKHSKSQNSLRGSRTPSKVCRVSKSMTSIKSNLPERSSSSPTIPSMRSRADVSMESFNPDLMITSLSAQSADGARTDRGEQNESTFESSSTTSSTENTEHFRNPDVFVEVAHRTKSVLPFTKLAFPEFNGHVSPLRKEPFHDRPGGVQRKSRVSSAKLYTKSMIFDDIDRMIHPQNVIDKTVYDIDLIISTNSHLRSGASREPAYHAYCTDDIKIKNFPSPDSVDTSDTLQFNSLFESGNLRKAVQIRKYEYDLILNSDINSNHHHQWFYFEVSGMKADIPYRFNMVNCEKPNSQFNFGMQPLMYSVREAVDGRPSWVRAGFDICYYKNHYSRSSAAAGGQKGKSYFSLTFRMIFPHDDDICYMAYHYPYTYSMLQTHLFELEAGLTDNDYGNIYYKIQTLCETIGGNPCPVLTITSYPLSKDKEGIEQFRSRPYIFLSGRVHPGESNASWVMKGSLNFLMSRHPTAQALRDVYIFKIVPMLNPDGVINGSHRCSLSGEDLNRRWLDTSPDLHPTIYHTKGLLQYLQLIDKAPLVYCDYHGHSRRKNVFMYGCSSALSYLAEDNATVSSGSSGAREDTSYKTLPKLLTSAPAFSISNCSFVVEKSKEATARVVVWREIGVLRSYTMESTYCGCDQGPYKGFQIGTRELEEMGKKFCEALLKLKRTGQHVRQPSNSTSLTALVTQSVDNESPEEEICEKTTTPPPQRRDRIGSGETVGCHDNNREDAPSEDEESDEEEEEDDDFDEDDEVYLPVAQREPTPVEETRVEGDGEMICQEDE